MITDIAAKALRFIRDNPDCYAREVGQHLWPDHIMHNKPAGDRGGGIAGALVAGGYMGKLHKRGLISGYSGTYQITTAGKTALREMTGE